jgi:hypothetical protein
MVPTMSTHILAEPVRLYVGACPSFEFAVRAPTFSDSFPLSEHDRDRSPELIASR